MKTELLGTLQTRIVGIAFAEARPAPGRPVRLVREPANPHDRYAIRVETRGGRRAGYIPRRTARWLAPLLDRGWIRMTARAGEGGGAGWIPLAVRVWATAKSRALVEGPEPPLTPAEETLAEVLAVYPPSTEAARRALDRLRTSVLADPSRPVLPETRLLLALEPPRVSGGGGPAAGRVAAAAEVVRRGLAAAVIGEPVSAGPLTLFPVTLAGTGDPGVIPFDLALERGQVQVTEVGEGGDVNALEVVSTEPEPVLIPHGLVLVGGKQDRMVALSVVVPAGGRRRVPVACVEAGRWHRETDDLKPRRVAPAMVRAEAAVPRAEAVAAVQGGVWRGVSRCAMATAAWSPTEALDEIFDQADLAVADELLARLPDGTSGLIAAAGKRVFALDVFATPDLLAPMRRRLVESWLLEAPVVAARADGTPAPGEARALLEAAAGNLVPTPGSDSGDGFILFQIEAPGLSGSALAGPGCVLQLSAFAEAGHADGVAV